MDTLQIPISDTLKVFLEKQAFRNGFESPTEYVQALLSKLQQREGANAELEDKLREAMREPSIEANSLFWKELKEEFLQAHPDVK
jgi:Arc/MetJ-type ribon-helix-helix transcriptional regulator